MKGKVILIDGGAITFNSIHLFGTMTQKRREGSIPSNSFIPPIGYTYTSMILSALKRIGVQEDDKVIIAIDARNSWRKAFYLKYKGQRKEARKKQSHINWEKAFNSIEVINSKLENSTEWHFIKLEDQFNLLDLLQTKEGKELIGEDYQDWMFQKNYGIEADDILSVGSSYFKDSEVILVTGDKDIYQLAYNKNTKIYSLNLKIKGKGAYAIIKQPLKILNEKIRLGDISDNIIVDKLNDTPLEQKRREFIINLLSLPNWVKNPIEQKFDNLPKKEVKPKELPYQNSLAKRYFDIYKKDKIITYEYCEQLMEKRAKRKEKKDRLKKLEKKKAELKDVRLEDLSKAKFNGLKRSGFLWEIYPEAKEAVFGEAGSGD